MYLERKSLSSDQGSEVGTVLFQRVKSQRDWEALIKLKWATLMTRYCHLVVIKIQHSNSQVHFTFLLFFVSDLSWNMIEWIHPDAFATLHSLIKL